jgi:hypothetical protein
MREYVAGIGLKYPEVKVDETLFWKRKALIKSSNASCSFR